MSDLPGRLSDELAREDDEVLPADPEARQRFQLTDDAKAAWAMRKLVECRHTQAAVEAVVAPERDRLAREQAALDGFVERETAEVRQFADYLAGLLSLYARDQRLSSGRKTVNTPYGKVTTTSKQASVTVVDEDALVTYLMAEDRFDALNVKPKLSEVKRAALKDGEALPGVEPLPVRDDDFSVNVKPEL